ncbi:interaptin-like isoform X1 [Branchiostoma lanceolatum]|uniref:interaptin-like isoform X1 n=1 Tax=Branchiostoma lanceolatum TaxID=7740 RepID=UPI003454E343
MVRSQRNTDNMAESQTTVAPEQVKEVIKLAKQLQSENSQLKEQQKNTMSQVEQLVLILHEAQQETKRYKTRANQYELLLKRAQDRFGKMSGKKLESLMSAPGVSKEVFDDLVRQNAQLKRHLEQTLKDRGQDMRNFMSAQNSDDLLKSVKEQLEQKDEEIKMMKEAIRDASNSDGKVQAEHLLDKVHALQKSDQIKSTWLDLFRLENEKLQKDVLSMSNELKQEKHSLLQQEKANHVDGRLQRGSRDIHQQIKDLERTLQVQKQKYEAQIFQLTQQLHSEGHLRQQAGGSTQGQFGSSQGDIQALQRKVDDLKSELQRAVDENAAISAQSACYKEDFEAEQQERNNQKTDYEAKLKQMQEYINKLSSECESLNSMLSRERFEKNQFKKQIEKQIETFQMNPAAALYGMGCNRQVNLAMPNPQMGLQPGLMARGSPTTPNPYTNQAGPWMNQPLLPQMVAVDSADGARQDSGESGSSEENVRRVCPRCEREFFDQEKFEAHVQRCIDG